MALGPTFVEVHDAVENILVVLEDTSLDVEGKMVQEALVVVDHKAQVSGKQNFNVGTLILAQFVLHFHGPGAFLSLTSNEVHKARL